METPPAMSPARGGPAAHPASAPTPYANGTHHQATPRSPDDGAGGGRGSGSNNGGRPSSRPPSMPTSPASSAHSGGSASKSAQAAATSPTGSNRSSNGHQPPIGPPTWRRMPCKARSVPQTHTAETAFLTIPPNATHGLVLSCSHAECRKSGKRFRYCAVCDLPVAKRNFLKRHSHGLSGIQSPAQSPRTDDDDVPTGPTSPPSSAKVGGSNNYDSSNNYESPARHAGEPISIELSNGRQTLVRAGSAHSAHSAHSRQSSSGAHSSASSPFKRPREAGTTPPRDRDYDAYGNSGGDGREREYPPYRPPTVAHTMSWPPSDGHGFRYRAEPTHDGPQGGNNHYDSPPNHYDQHGGSPNPDRMEADAQQRRQQLDREARGEVAGRLGLSPYGPERHGVGRSNGQAPTQGQPPRRQEPAGPWRQHPHYASQSQQSTASPPSHQSPPGPHPDPKSPPYVTRDVRMLDHPPSHHSQASHHSHHSQQPGGDPRGGPHPPPPVAHQYTFGSGSSSYRLPPSHHLSDHPPGGHEVGHQDSRRQQLQQQQNQQQQQQPNNRYGSASSQSQSSQQQQQQQSSPSQQQLSQFEPPTPEYTIMRLSRREREWLQLYRTRPSSNDAQATNAWVDRILAYSDPHTQEEMHDEMGGGVEMVLRTNRETHILPNHHGNLNHGVPNHGRGNGGQGEGVVTPPESGRVNVGADAANVSNVTDASPIERKDTDGSGGSKLSALSMTGESVTDLLEHAGLMDNDDVNMNVNEHDLKLNRNGSNGSNGNDGINDSMDVSPISPGLNKRGSSSFRVPPEGAPAMPSLGVDGGDAGSEGEGDGDVDDEGRPIPPEEDEVRASLERAKAEGEQQRTQQERPGSPSVEPNWGCFFPPLCGALDL